jgi:hypothetical protein
MHYHTISSAVGSSSSSSSACGRRSEDVERDEIASELEHEYSYRANARNLHVGVWKLNKARWDINVYQYCITTNGVDSEGQKDETLQACIEAGVTTHSAHNVSCSQT